MKGSFLTWRACDILRCQKTAVTELKRLEQTILARAFREEL
jgi:hypothetical protein